MSQRTLTIALVAHDNKKKDLIDWAKYNRGTLSRHHLISTGTTGELINKHTDLPVKRLHSGPLGGDQELGALIVNHAVDVLIFFWDGLDAHPHDPDVKALLRLTVVWNIPTACNRSSADMLISSPMLENGFKREIPDHSEYTRNRKVLIEQAKKAEKESKEQEKS